MFLNTLHELNSLVTEGLRKSGLNIEGLKVGESTLTSMDFIKPDHTTISMAVPVFKMSVHQAPWIRTLQDWADVVVSFVLDTANEFTRPRVHLSNVYLNYDPRSNVSGPSCIHFDIAIWDYVDSEVQWLEVNNGSGSLVDSFELGRHQLKVSKQAHVLLKQNPFEINVWTQNILRDIGYITAAGDEASALAYVNKLKQELLAKAEDAAGTLSKMERGAQIHDAVNSLWRGEHYREVAEILTQAVGQEISLYSVGDRTFLTLGDSVFGPDQAFALIAGHDIEDQDRDEEVEDTQTEEQRAIGIILDSGRQRRDARARRILSDISRADGLPADLNDINSRPLYYLRPGVPHTLQEQRDQDDPRNQAKVPADVFMSLDPVFASKETVERAVERELGKGDSDV